MTAKNKVAWTFIVKADDESELTYLSNALASINGYVDAIYVQLNSPKGKPISPKVRAVALRYTDNIYDYEWTGNFVEARNAIFKKVPKHFDWIGWMDCDDTINIPEKIQEVCSIMPKDIDGIRILYDYGHDDHGNVTIAHWATRIVRNNGSFAWKSSIDDDEVSVHETLIAVRTVKSAANDEFKVIHHATRDRSEASLIRNITILQAMYTRQVEKGDIDPRILFYLATHYYDAYDFNQTLVLLAKYLEISGWSEERSEAHYYIGKILANRKNDNAKKAFLMSIGENPDNVASYIELAKLDMEMERFEQAANWLEKAKDIKREISAMVRHDNQYDLYTLLSQAYVNIGGLKLEDAMTYAEKALRIRPYDPSAVENRDTVKALINYRDNIRAVTRLIRELEHGDEKYKILPLLKALPKDLDDSIPVVDALQRYTPPFTWPKRSIAIYVGQSPLGLWGPWSLDAGGTGGSEEAVIRLSKELTALGWFVTVYGSPGERAGTYDGVVWKQYWQINEKDNFDVVISWRQPNFFDYKFKARKKYLWLHDILPEAEFTKQRIKNIDKVIFVSQYHADRPEFKNIPTAKKFISANGIDPSSFVAPKVKRDPHRLIYMSSNERGLRVLLDIWPDVKKAVPKATLDVYYGWNSFDAINKTNPERMAWKASMVQTMKELDGVTERGRVGQNELHKEIYKSGIFAYPCTFPEVSCITAMKAQAGGAIPVTSDFANMKEVVQFGEKVPMRNFEEADIERYKKHLISWLLYPEKQERIRREMMKWAIKELTWTKVALQWHTEMTSK